MQMFVLLFATLSWFISADAGPDVIQTVVEWKRLQFAYSSETERQNDIRSGIYDPDVPAPIDVDVFYNVNLRQRMIFVSIPKFGPGVPVTFGTVSSVLYQGDPVIEPFPSWDWHRNTARCSSTRLVSVFRVKVDRCGLLWILDSGNEGNGVICKPQLVVFDLKQWPRVRTPYYRYEFPNEVYDRNTSIFVTPVIESRGQDCKAGAFAYVADTTTRSIVVTDLNTEYSFRLQDPRGSMNPEPALSNFNIAGQTFFLDDGVLGMDLSPEQNYFDDDRYLFYSALAGSRETFVSTSDLKRGLSTPVTYNTYRTPRRSQSAAMAISRRGVALFGLLSNITINCWNIYSPDYGQYIDTVYSNPVTMQFPSGAKIITNPNNYEEYWVLTDRLQKLMNDGYNFNEVNFRISVGMVDDLLAGTRCI